MERKMRKRTINPQPESLKELEKEYNKIESVCAGDTKFMAINSFYLAKKMESLLQINNKDNLHIILDFLSDNNLVIGEREGDAFKEMSFEEIHKLF